MRRSGIALVLVSGILVFLSLAGAGMLAMASGSRMAGTFQIDAVHARLLARSGIEFATARLLEDTAPRNPATAANQADDWTFRDDSSVVFGLEKTRNPSYAQGEPYTDIPENGRYDLGGDPYRDLDGNGRFDAWSGRLRGRHGMTGSTFSLRVEAAAGGVCVNGGFLDSENRNGNAVFDHHDMGVGYMRLPGVFPAISTSMGAPPDPVTKRNGRIADVLSRLGRILENPLPLPQPWDVTLPGPRVAIPYSAVGEKIIQGRPLGGYRSLEQVRGVLTPEEWSRMRGMIGLDPGARGTFGSLDLRNGPAPNRLIPEKRQLIDLNHAPLPVLEALALDLQPGGEMLSPERDPDPLAAAGLVHSITRIDAQRVAEFLAARRPFASWYDFYRQLDQAKGDLFLGRHASIQRRWVDMLFANAYPKLMGTRLCWWGPPFSYLSYDIDRDFPLQDSPSPVGYRRPRIFSKLEGWHGWYSVPTAPYGRILTSFTLSPWCRGPRPADGGWKGNFDKDNRLPYGSLEYDLEPGNLFSVECQGSVREGAGRDAARSVLDASLKTSESIRAATQADFENRGPFPLPAGVTIRERPLKDRTETYPMYPLDAVAELAGTVAFTPYAGSVRLADRVTGLRGDEAFYVPGWQGGGPEAWEDHFRDRVANARWAQSHHGVGGDWDTPSECAGPQDLAASGFAIVGAGPVTAETVLSECCHSHSPDCLYDGVYRWGGGGGPEEEGPTWGRYGTANEGDFPLMEQGKVRRGTFELWSAGSAHAQTNPMHVRIRMVENCVWMQSKPDDDYYSEYYKSTPESADAAPPLYGVETLNSPVCSTGLDWHIVAFVFDSEAEPGVTMYVDGISMASGTYYAHAVDPNWKQAFTCARSVYPITNTFSGGSIVSRGQDEIRLYRDPLSQGRIGVQALQSRYWTPEPGGPVPSFRSPLYSFIRPVPMVLARYDGFVPRVVREATEAWNRKAAPGERKIPLRVRLIFYPGPDGDGPPLEVGFPEDSYLQGGCELDLRGVRAGSFRYVVELDVSALDVFNNETPVFDGLSVTFRTGSFPSFDPSDR